MTQALLEKDTPWGDEAVGSYLHQIRQYPVLTQEQERQLAMACARGDENAIRAMVNSNLRLVVSIAKTYANRGVPLLDLIQEGSIGLLEAAQRFDYTMENRFSTYATKWILRGVYRCWLTHSDMVHVPLHTAEKMQKVLKTQYALQQELGREPETALVAQRCGLPENKVQQLLSLLPQTCSLDTLVGEDGDTLQLLVQDDATPQPQEELVRRELKEILDAMLEKLKPRQQQVLRLRFGMEDGICHTVEQIGTILGVSKERARQIEHQAMEKLQALGADFGLEDFLE